LGELGGGLLVAADKEGGWPEDDDSGGCRQTVIGALLILDADSEAARVDTACASCASCGQV